MLFLEGERLCFSDQTMDQGNTIITHHLLPSSQVNISKIITYNCRVVEGFCQQAVPGRQIAGKPVPSLGWPESRHTVRYLL
jgi:hypothetical protein